MSKNFDLSSAMEKLQTMMSSEEGKNQLKNMIGAFTGGSSNNANYEQDQYEGSESVEEKTNEENDAADFDFDSFNKIKQLLSGSGMNKGKHSKFLNALKPYLKKNRQDKLESAIKIINFVQLAKFMKKTNNAQTD